MGAWSMPHPGHFTLMEETRYPLCRRLGGSQGRSVRGRKISPPPAFDPQTVQAVASRYTDYAISDHLMHYILCYLEIARQAVRNIMGE